MNKRGYGVNLKKTSGIALLVLLCGCFGSFASQRYPAANDQHGVSLQPIHPDFHPVDKPLVRNPDTSSLAALDHHIQPPWWLKWISTAAASELQPGEWYVRLIAEIPSMELKDQGNVLGSLLNTVDEHDRHDLQELAPFSSPYLTIVFPHEDWGEQSGEYTSDFHQPRDWRSGDEWDFVVKSSVSDQKITLRWEGFGETGRLARMSLLDVESGKIVQAEKGGKLQSYTFTMAGEVHRFKWIYQDSQRVRRLQS